MENLYIYMLAALAFLAVADLVVGVSNDAVNFLNSAIGSKAVSFKTIMIVASIGVAVGAMTSSGMMEVARKGIFNPGEFMFNEIMVIFMAVMLTDILLLDFFNTLGLPTSTTVSIVFELLGASVAVAIIKIYADNSQSIIDLGNYINNEKAIEIILGILLSVIVAFTIGAIIQYVSRLLLSFNFEKKPDWYSAIFSGFALTSIMYFIIIKGLKNATFMDESVLRFLNDHPVYFVEASFVAFTLITYLAVKFFNAKIYTIIIIVGTFALAVAFAGNDLVNFIGVPIAAYNSYEAWSASGAEPTNYVMSALGEPVQTEPYLLLVAGLIMVLTLWFSSKARAVVKTSVDLSRQDEVKERFEPNYLSRNVVRLTIGLNDSINKLLPNSYKNWAEKQFLKPKAIIKQQDKPAFDLVRAAVNLMVASVLISIATSMKLPLSTTYVTFMVAMGTSLADRAWGSESAVYRVAGVLNVIGGWFFTAFSAFIAAAVMAFILYYGGGYALAGLLVLAIVLLIRSYLAHRKSSKIIREEDQLEKAESSSTQGVIHESASNIANVIKRGNRIYTSAINGLAVQDLKLLKKNRRHIDKLSNEIDDLKDNIFYFIRNLDEPSVAASNFYINILAHLQDITQSLDYISKASYKHINNNHKKLKFSQVKELKDLDSKLELLFTTTQKAFESRSFEQIGAVLENKSKIFNLVRDKIQKQVERTRSEESSPKNTTLYFSLLLETKDLLTSMMNLLEEYYQSHDSSVEPAKLNTDQEE
ncbi:phosphate:sodium symporter [Winogradskyella sp. J14-2]|uniref:inorganic phosphate transporter n=1 Tax=Winogradskyella sp. J14-2 TaxID=1936080 RepID=UPI0009727D56|nr:inorganic phosphate transporter [Winogradskyella sp. J14-2]APY08212.1 phosphate:sodium symporter [Winogradskyella sp. J14-2]